MFIKKKKKKSESDILLLILEMGQLRLTEGRDDFPMITWHFVG